MRRRDFIVWFGSAAATLPLPARTAGSEQGLSGRSDCPGPASLEDGPDPIDRAAKAFVHTLRDLGYVEGNNLILERRSLQLRQERSGEITAELARLGIDVIVTSGNEMAREAARVAPGVPIVMALSSGPVEARLVASLARPVGNITGLTVDAGPEIEAKRLQMLKEAVPSAYRIAFLGDSNDWEEPRGKSVRAAAATLGVSLIHAEHSATEYADAFASNHSSPTARPFRC
jgi:putative ABC transport system substrate-binding protein